MMMQGEEGSRQTQDKTPVRRLLRKKALELLRDRPEKPEGRGGCGVDESINTSARLG